MSAKSDPPGEDVERRGPLSIMPTTEGIDSDWGAEPEATTAPAAEPPAHAAPAESHPEAKVPPPAKMPAIVAPEVESVRAAPQSVRPTRTSTSPPAAPKRSGAGAYVVAGGLVAAAGIWLFVRSPEPQRPNAPVAVESPPMASANPVPALPPDPVVVPAASATDPVAPSASAAPSVPAASVPATDTKTDTEAGDTIAVRINITPEGAKLVQKGEEVGTLPMTLELPRGERRVFEVVAKGYYPRRLVVDGTKSEIAFGLKPVEP